MNLSLNKYILIVICALIFWLAGVPFVFSNAIQVVCENLSYNTDYNISVEKPKLYLNIIPIAYVKADRINIQSKKTNDKIYIEDLNLKIRILPLLSGRIHIDSIKSSKIDVNALINKDTNLNKKINIKNAKFKCENLDIENVKINVNADDIGQIIYTAKNIFYQKNGRYLNVKANSQININNIISEANINVYLPKNNDVNKSIIDMHISNFDISPFSVYVKNYLLPNLVNAQGIIDINADKHNIEAVFKNVAIYMKDSADTIVFPEELKISSGLSLTRKKINLDRAIVESKNIHTVISGTIENYLDKPIPEYNLDIRIHKSKIEDFISMLPSFKTEDIDVYKLKKYKFYGDILGNFSVKGHNLEPSVNGSIYVNNGVLTKPIPNAKGATVKLDFKGKYLNFDVQVPANIGEKVLVKGGVELYNVKYSDMHVWSTKNVDLALAEEKVVPIHEILNFVIGPVPIMDIKGQGNIDIVIKGNRKNPHVWGILNFYNVKTYFYDIPDLILTNAEAVLSFDDESAVFTLNKGLINEQKVSIDGVCNLSGKFDFDVTSNNQKLEDIYKSIMHSTIIEGMKNMLPQVESVNGLSNLKVKVYGHIKDIEDIKFNENFFIKGTLEFLGNAIESQGIKIYNTHGKTNFENTNAEIDISSFIGKSPLMVKGSVKNQIADISIQIPRLNLKDVIPKDDKLGREVADILVNLTAKYKGNITKTEYDKLDFNAQVLEVAKRNKLKLSNGSVSLKNGKLLIKDINGSFDGTKSSFNINLQADGSSPIINGVIKLKDFELSLINSFGEYGFIPQNIRDVIKQIHFNKGKINLNAKISNNNVNASTDIGGIDLTYVPINMPIKVINGSIYIRKNFLGLNKINMLADDMPILIDGGIDDIFDNPDFNLYVNSKPKQDFIDKYINNNRIYPIKIKGDIVYWIKLKGTKNNLNAETEVNLAKEASLYYLGATIGDIENAIILNSNINVIKQNSVKVKEFSYDKLVDSQGKRRTRLNMLKASGGIDILSEDIGFHDLKIKTNHPTDARILNVLFRKPNIKQGQFTSDIKFNGVLSRPHITGIFHIAETNIPFFDMNMKNASFDFKDKTIDMVSIGEILGNDIKFKGTLRNKLTTPYYIENAELYTKVIDFNYIFDKLKMAQVNDNNVFDSLANFDLQNTVIKKLKLSADEIKLRNLSAVNVEAITSITDKKIFNIDDFSFYIANGSLSGKLSYNMLNSNTGITLQAKSINANDMAIALFNLDNQIYGDLTGNLKLSCNGSDFNKCMETLNGSLNFDVSDGKMPKLGSLEYLLKAGNLLKGGLTGLSINSVIDILTPLKTGNFSEIYGKMTINDGKTKDIEIATRGKDLSLFITGSYNFGTSNAEMEVLGLLSKKISTMFGPIGNVSINTLFNVVPGIDLTKDSKLLDKINKIPGIELNSKAFRKFIAEINGNIKGDNYVTSFKWIN